MDRVERYLQDFAARLDVRPEDREHVVAELRAHLHDKVQDARRAEPERPLDDVQRKVLDGLGDPEALALAYGPGGKVELRDADGRTVMRFSDAVTRASRAMGRGAVAVGRGTGKALRTTVIVLLIVFGVSLVSATVLTIVLFDDVSDVIRSYDTSTVHSSYESCLDRPCQTSAPIVKSFFVHGDAKAVRFDLDVRVHAATNGTFEVRVTDPGGEVVLERSYLGGHNATLYEYQTWAPEPGNWRVEYMFTSFTGTVGLDVSTLGLPL